VEARRFTQRVAPIAAALFCVAAIAMPVAITIAFGRSFRSASTTAILLLAAALIRGAVAWSKTLPLALGDATLRLVVSIVDVAGLVTAAVLLANTGDAVGVGIGYVAVAAAAGTYWLRYARRRSREGGET
jgi:O-antigen/teichoic acid export membrane protein